MEDTSIIQTKRKKYDWVQFEFNRQRIVQNISSVLKNDDASNANDLCDDLPGKLKPRNKLIKMTDWSALGWETVAKYESDRIASDSDDGKKIKQAEKRTLTKRKRKRSNKLTPCVPSQRPLGQ